MAGGSSSRRSRLETAARERPTASAASAWVRENSPIRRCRRLRFFQRIEVFALDVLDQRHGDDGAVVQVADHHRHIGQAGFLRGAPAAFAGHDLVTLAARQLAHHDRLDHALGLDRLGQLAQLGRVHAHARLVLAGLQLLDRDLAQAFAGLRLGRRGRRRPWGRAVLPGHGPGRAFSPGVWGGHLRVLQSISLAVCLRSAWRRRISPARPR